MWKEEERSKHRKLWHHDHMVAANICLMPNPWPLLLPQISKLARLPVPSVWLLIFLSQLVRAGVRLEF